MAAAALAVAAVPPQAAWAGIVKVGVILTYSGSDAALGEQIERGINLYTKLHNARLPAGTTIELIRRDDTGPNPDVAKRLAQELILREQVQFLTGGQWTPNATAVAALSKEAKVPFVVMGAGGSAVTEQSPYVIRTGWTLWQTSYPLGPWAVGQGLKRAYTVVNDFTPGHDGETAFTKSFTENGGEIVGAVRIPLKTVDYLPYLQKIKDANPDTVYLFAPGGPRATTIMKAFNDIGITKSSIRVIGPGDTTSDEELPNMGKSALGVTTLLQYSPSATRPANQAFIAAWKKEFGENAVPTSLAVAAWDGMAAIYDAVIAQKGKIEPDRTMELLSHWSNPDSPRGPIRIDPETRDIVQNVYLRRVEEVAGTPVNVEFQTIEQVPDPWKALKRK
ncbi:ABC transporter substrate binding protein (branched amino acid) [Paramagnetospirillum caucaseum]|uniref:ABC transporter substrate binding protein (Branched amino acid) n=1 Tax=Paramagnetospirillum caucaseum TaxID=1244869 RepID=M3A7Z3_9PROT|nr:ABC transporter substrate binding protein (branched amino acid) [Paramagnetospirillum caucaseum]